MYDKKFNLVLDLDLTLVNTKISKVETVHKSGKCYDYTNLMEHNDFKNININNLLHHPNFSFTLPEKYGDTVTYIKYDVYFRPYLFFFLYNLKKYYNLIIYTHGTTTYANMLLSYINNIIKTYYKSSMFVSWFVNKKNTETIFYIVVSRTDTELPVIKSLDVLPFLDQNFTIIIDDNPNAWDKKYHSRLYKIPPYKLTNNYDNVLLILLQDLIDYTMYSNTDNLILLKFES